MTKYSRLLSSWSGNIISCKTARLIQNCFFWHRDLFKPHFIFTISCIFLMNHILSQEYNTLRYMASLYYYWVLWDSIAYCWINVFRIVHQVYIWHCLPSNWYGTVPRYERRNTGQNHYRAFPHFAQFKRNRGVCLVSRKRNVYRFGDIRISQARDAYKLMAYIQDLQ